MEALPKRNRNNQKLFSPCFLQSRYRFTQIAVDPQIKTPGGKTYDVIFVGTGECSEGKSLFCRIAFRDEIFYCFCCCLANMKSFKNKNSHSFHLRLAENGSTKENLKFLNGNFSPRPLLIRFCSFMFSIFHECWAISFKLWYLHKWTSSLVLWRMNSGASSFQWIFFFGEKLFCNRILLGYSRSFESMVMTWKLHTLKNSAVFQWFSLHWIHYPLKQSN